MGEGGAGGGALSGGWVRGELGCDDPVGLLLDYLGCRCTSLIRHSFPVGRYSRHLPRALQWSYM